MAMRDDYGAAPGLGPRALLHEEKLPAGMVAAGIVQVDHNLQREDQVAVKVAVQGIPVPCLVAKQDRSRLTLPGAVADSQPLVERVRPPGGPAELGRPVTRDRPEPRVQSATRAKTLSLLTVDASLSCVIWVADTLRRARFRK